MGGPVAPAAPAPAVQTAADIGKLNNDYLTNAFDLMKQIQALIAEEMDLAPPSGAMAGVFCLNDQLRGVWNAPANLPASHGPETARHHPRRHPPGRPARAA